MVCWKARRRGNGLDQISGISENRECGSFTAAAQQLSFTQSGVSHAISGLEEELGGNAAEPQPGGVTLTADGWALMPYIQEICRQQRSIEERAKDLQGLETGVVRVAVFQRVGAVDALHPEKSFREQYPNIEFELLPSNYNTEIARWIQDGTADCGFLVLPTEANLDCWLRAAGSVEGHCAVGSSAGGAGAVFRRRHLTQYPSFCWRRETTTKFRRCWTRWECSPMCSTGCSRIR